MKATLFAAISSCTVIVALPSAISAKPLEAGLVNESRVDRVADVERVVHAPSKVLADTIWVADWDFDDGSFCNDTGWVKYDNRILNDGSNYWSIDSRFNGTGGIGGNAAILGKHDLIWARDGYGNSWDYSIVLKYRGAGSTLSFDYLSDSETGYDFVTVEADSAGVSESLVDYSVDPSAAPAAFRSVLLTVDGVHTSTVSGLPLLDFGVPATEHEVYIRFCSDGGYSDEDGFYTTIWNAGLVVDNVVVTGTLAYSENFEGALNPNVSLSNTAPSTPFGEWARLFQHITDNDICTENSTCAWLWTDPQVVAFFPDMAFAPGGTVIHNWLDDIIVSPWVSLPSATSTLLYYRRFPGNDFSLGRIVQNWSVRTKVRIDNTDTSTPGDSIVAITPWGHAGNWNSLTTFSWITSIVDMSAYIDPRALEVQVRFRISDWQYIADASPPTTVNPGPGPYVDRVRIGRVVHPGPRILDIPSFYATQDGFPSARVPSSAGEDFAPTTSRFGTIDFAAATVDLHYIDPIPRWFYNTRDSVVITVTDLSGAGVTTVGMYATIVAGPHVGKAPPPWGVGTNGFFYVPADTARQANGYPYEDRWFVDMDDEYFRGGDVMVYFWTATDGAGGFSSLPPGLTAPPTSIAAAQAATGGLLEVSYLPSIDWDPAYLARVAAHPSGKIDPTPEEIANSYQSSCILYYLQQYSSRRSGPAHRSAFMHTLDQLGYEGLYDVYYQTTLFSTYSTHLAGRATPEQIRGYSLIIQDSERGTGYLLIPPGGLREGVIDQQTWYRDWLAQASSNDSGRGTLWLIGENMADDIDSYSVGNPLVSEDMGVTLTSSSQPLFPYPNIEGQGAFTWADGSSTDFTGDLVTLNVGECAAGYNDGLGATGTAVVTHRFTLGSASGEGAAVLNSDPVESWNSILMSFAWGDLIDVQGTPPGNRRADLMAKILTGVLPDSCSQGAQPTDVPDQAATVPRVTVLHPNVPNPFNPTTTIRFDLARSGHVRLRIYDVAGRVVATLIDGPMAVGYGRTVLWNGLDSRGWRVPSGVYFSQLVTTDVTATRKLVLLR